MNKTAIIFVTMSFITVTATAFVLHRQGEEYKAETAQVRTELDRTTQRLQSVRDSLTQQSRAIDSITSVKVNIHLRAIINAKGLLNAWQDNDIKSQEGK